MRDTYKAGKHRQQGNLVVKALSLMKLFPCWGDALSPGLELSRAGLDSHQAAPTKVVLPPPKWFCSLAFWLEKTFHVVPKQHEAKKPPSSLTHRGCYALVLTCLSTGTFQWPWMCGTLQSMVRFSCLVAGDPKALLLCNSSSYQATQMADFWDACFPPGCLKKPC